MSISLDLPTTLDYWPRPSHWTIFFSFPNDPNDSWFYISHPASSSVSIILTDTSSATLPLSASLKLKRASETCEDLMLAMLLTHRVYIFPVDFQGQIRYYFESYCLKYYSSSRLSFSYLISLLLILMIPCTPITSITNLNQWHTNLNTSHLRSRLKYPTRLKNLHLYASVTPNSMYA